MPSPKIVNMHEAKTHLSRLVEAAVQGEPFIIARAGKPLVQVTTLEPARSKSPVRFGFAKGKWAVPDDFDTMMQDEIIAMFEGEH
jgi:prevent-host-death family protein